MLHDAFGTGKFADVLVAEWAISLEIMGMENVMTTCADGKLANRRQEAYLKAHTLT